MTLSAFGEKFTRKTGILELMEDIALAAASPAGEAAGRAAGRAAGTVDAGPLCMLGGGNPARIGAVEAVWKGRMEALLADGDGFGKLLGTYDSADGMVSFRAALASLFRREYGWDLGPQNVCIVNGSQVAVFYLLNALSGPDSKGRRRRVLFPLMPEYVGYADQAVSEDAFISVRPRIELRGDRRFKYYADLDRLESLLKREGESIGGMCVSRPTNPSGNVLTDDEVARLAELAERYRVPLITDNAYGLPFPGIIFTEAEPFWNPQVILSMSLSKIGLPSARTGIVVADEKIVQALSAVNAVASLATGTIGQAIAEPLVASGEILEMSRNTVRPYYQEKRTRAMALIDEVFRGLPCRIHESEGAIFLWLWFDDPRIEAREVYRRAKARKVLVLSGEYFSFGVFDDGSAGAAWDHPRHCIRLNYSAPDAAVERGVHIIAEEVRSILEHGC